MSDTKTYSAVRNPRWVNKAKTTITCEVNWDHVDDEEWCIFDCKASGDFPHTHQIFQECVNGDYGTIAEWADPIDNYDLQDEVRRLRDSRLENIVDRVIMNPIIWEGLTAEKQQEWKDYRQNLLDLPAAEHGCTWVWNDEGLTYEINVPDDSAANELPPGYTSWDTSLKDALNSD